MAKEESKTEEERQQTTIQEFLWRDKMPLPVRDYLERYVAGEPTPYSDMVDEGIYGDGELIVAVLCDEFVSNDALPEGAKDYVQEYLYRLEESSGVHIWNTPDVARVAYPLMFRGTNGEPGYMLEGETLDASLIKAALRRLCTRRELSEFYDRHGFEDGYKGRGEMPGSVMTDEGNYLEAAAKLARHLADPRTPEKLRRDLGAALVKLASLTNTHVDHPALCERAMVLMCESKVMLANSENEGHPAHQTAKHLIDLIDSLPSLPDEEGGDE